MNQRVIITTRRRLEAKIEELIGLLDLLDGDPDLEDGGDTEANGDELDYNGDEADYSGYAEEWVGPPGAGYDGSGDRIARGMLRGLQKRRAGR
ncbi:Hypothetical protein NGAL_HAMBI2605_10500 [Neorhizobium galegae bv. orientalis]|nr:Hypothetical protein NGAL_HAMBI2605_10500 [Neorhizobium galegae bv. orientalis]